MAEVKVVVEWTIEVGAAEALGAAAGFAEAAIVLGPGHAVSADIVTAIDDTIDNPGRSLSVPFRARCGCRVCKTSGRVLVRMVTVAAPGVPTTVTSQK